MPGVVRKLGRSADRLKVRNAVLAGTSSYYVGAQ
jgi:hypothetical protein